MVGAGLALTAAPALKAAVSALCCVRHKTPGNPHPLLLYHKSPITLSPYTKTYTTGRFTQFVRENNILDAVEAAVVRKKRKTAKMNQKARAQANKMNAVDVALTTTLAETTTDLDEEITSYGNSKGALRTYLQDQYKSRKFIHNGIYHSIPEVSEFRSSTKPFKLRMNPDPSSGTKVTTDMQISHRKRLLYLMISEDRERPLEATVGHGDTQLVRRLPVIAHAYMNPVSTRLKQLQETTVQNMSLPKDNPLYDQLHKAYGQILYDGGYYRVISIQFVPNKGKNVYPCWEATTEPVYKNDAGHYVVHDRHLVAASDGTKKLLKAAEVTNPVPNPSSSYTLMRTHHPSTGPLPLDRFRLGRIQQGRRGGAR
jgi:hypothetical protein